MLNETAPAVIREFRVLRRPALLLVALGFGGVLLALALSAQTSASSNWQLVQEDAQRIRAEYASCLAHGPQPGCEESNRAEEASHREYVGEQLSRFRLSAAMQHPAGALGIAAGFLTSFPGLLAIGVLAAFHVAGEWSWGTVRVLEARTPQRLPFVAAKIASMFIGGSALLVAGWVVLALLGVVTRSMWTLPPAPPDFDMTRYVVSGVGKGLLVVAVASAVVTCIAVVVRHPLGTVAVVLTALLGSLALTVPAATFKWSPAFWLAQFMQWRPSGMLFDHIWADRFPALDPQPGLVLSQGACGLALVCFGIGAFAVGWLANSRLEVEG